MGTVLSLPPILPPLLMLIVAMRRSADCDWLAGLPPFLYKDDIGLPR